MTTPLQTIWATLPTTMSTSTKLMTLNSMMVAGPSQDVSRIAIKTILIGAGVITSLQTYAVSKTATQPCLTATNYLLALIEYEASAVGDILQTSIPANLTMIETIGPDLLSDPANGMTQDILSRIMALITPTVPWWKANGFSGPILVDDLISAGNLY